MPKGYVFCEIDVSDPETYKREYLTRSGPAVEKFGGKFLVRGGSPAVVEGDRSPRRVVIIEFDSPETARAFYESELYQRAAEWRFKTARTHYYLLEGSQ